MHAHAADLQKLMMRREVAISMDGHTHHSHLSPSPASFAIDFVYCWAGEAVQHDGDKEGLQEKAEPFRDDHNGGEGFGEIRWSLKMLEAHAPWFNKLYILVNGQADRPHWLTEESEGKVVMVDRCQLFTNPADCPTRNTFACQSVMHKIPNLTEHFVSMQDDWLIVNPVQPSDFFTSEGKPLVVIRDAEQEVALYSNVVPGPNMPPSSHPNRMEHLWHLPLPMLVSFGQQLETTYPDWFAFVRSHRTRFACCNASVVDNGLDESFDRIYPHELLKQHVGTKQSLFTDECWWWADDSSNVNGVKQKFQKCLVHKLLDTKTKFMVLQTVLTADTWTVVEQAMLKNLEKYPTKFVKDLPTARPAAAPMMSSLMEMHSRSPPRREHLTFAR